MTSKEYREYVLERLRYRNERYNHPFDTEFLYNEKLIDEHSDYVEWCRLRGMSAYKCLLFLHDRTQGDYIIEDTEEYKEIIRTRRIKKLNKITEL